MRKNLMAGNWKMNKTIDEAVSLAKELVEKNKNVNDRDIMIAPTFVCLKSVYDVTKGTNIKLGSQNMYFEESGAFTGEISPDMLKSCGVEYVILGHSERRHIFGETDELINKKVLKAIEKSFKPVLCVGELLEEREAGKAVDVVKEQVINGLKDVKEDDLKNVVIAYEPVWAIGTGKTASPEDADEMHKEIRKIISSIYSDNASENIVILYGGSMKDSNVDNLMAKENIDGGLVGGAALKSDSFSRIIQFQ